jgi:hypothetical protein
MIFKPRKFRILKTLINMKFYLAIAFALLLATAYGIRNKQATATGAAVDTTATTAAAADTCETYPYEYDNGSVNCSSTNTWCEDGTGTSTSYYEDICGEESSYKSNCTNSYDPVDWLWSSGTCTSSSCYGGECSECSNDYYSNWSEESNSNYNNNQCTNGDGSSDCKLLAYISLFFMYLLLISFV